jgi:hypothetical protein
MHNQRCTSAVCYTCYKSLCTTSLAEPSRIVALDPISDIELLRGERHEFEQDRISSGLTYFRNTRSGAPATRNGERRSYTTTSIRIRQQNVIEQCEAVGANRGCRQCHHPRCTSLPLYVFCRADKKSALYEASRCHIHVHAART